MTTLPPPTTSTSTSTTVPACPQATADAGASTTQLATPTAPNLAYSATPGGPAVGHVKESWGGPSTRPVLAQQNGWVQLRLSSRPNGSSGWIQAQSLTFSTTDYRIVISICQRSLTLFQGANTLYSAPVGVGRPQWPTPTGPSFVDAIVATPTRPAVHLRPDGSDPRDALERVHRVRRGRRHGGHPRLPVRSGVHQGCGVVPRLRPGQPGDDQRHQRGSRRHPRRRDRLNPPDQATKALARASAAASSLASSGFDR